MKSAREVLGDEEYQFPSEEYVATEPQSEIPASDFIPAENNTMEMIPPPASKGAQILEWVRTVLWGQHKRAVLIGGGIVAALITFQIMHHSNKPVPAPAPMPVPAPVVQPVVQPMVMPQPIDNHVNDQLNSLSRGEADNQQAVSQLQSQMSDVRDALSQASVTNAQLTQAVGALMDQVKNLSNQVQALKKNNQPGPAAPTVVYHLQGMIPGRAWILGSNGENDTVSVGDKITDYGTVVALDQNRGVVVTSSGKFIKYGPTDQ